METAPKLLYLEKEQQNNKFCADTVKPLQNQSQLDLTPGILKYV